MEIFKSVTIIDMILFWVFVITIETKKDKLGLSQERPRSFWSSWSSFNKYFFLLMLSSIIVAPAQWLNLVDMPIVLLVNLVFYVVFILFYIVNFFEGRKYGIKTIQVLAVIMIIPSILCDVGIFRDYSKEVREKNYIPNLQEKIGDLSQLRDKLAVNKVKITKTKEEFLGDIKSHLKEIDDECKGTNLCTLGYQQVAKKNATIYNDIVLIQKKKAYANKLHGIELQLTRAIKESELLSETAKADLKMVRAVGGKDTSNLIDEINHALKEYSPFTEEYVVDPKQLELEKPEEIWDQARK
jgi:hypothetical protein